MGTIWNDPLNASKGPKYKRVADTIRKAVDRGQLKVGAKLPPVRELAYQLSITPGTVARAYSVLTEEGVLRAEVGRGTFVAPPRTAIPEDVWSAPASFKPSADADQVSLFSPRLPDVGQVEVIRNALVQVAQSAPEDLLNYPTRDAYAPVREAAVNWLSDQALGPLSPEDLVLTHGGQSGLCVVLQTVITGQRPVILVEELSYAGFRRAAELLRADVVAVPIDEHGVRPDALDHLARQSSAQVLCLTPEVQNPTGGYMPLERRKAIVEVAERRNLQILEDDCYNMGDMRAPSFRALAQRRAWHVSSISKTLTPALRVGFALAPQGQGAKLRRSAEYGYFGLAQPLAELSRVLLGDPETRILAQKVRARVADYVRVAVNTLGAYDLNWASDVPFVWLRLPSGWRAAAFSRAAERQGVQIRSADEFALRDGRAPHAVRIAVNAHVTLDVFEDALLRLRTLLENPPEQISV